MDIYYHNHERVLLDHERWMKLFGTKDPEEAKRLAEMNPSVSKVKMVPAGEIATVGNRQYKVMPDGSWRKIK